jgi:hypothetical protein
MVWATTGFYGLLIMLLGRFGLELKQTGGWWADFVWVICLKKVYLTSDF